MQRLLRNGTILAGTLLAVLLVPAASYGQLATEIQLTGAEEVPRRNHDFHGTCNVILNLELSEIQVSCTHDVPEPTAAHIHFGDRGVNGPILYDLGDPTTPIQNVTVGVTGLDVSDFLNGNLYINVHNETYPGGAIRGQIEPGPPVGGAVLRFPLEPGQEVPPVSEDTSGECTFVLETGGDTLLVDCQHDVDDATAAHIHMGAPGVAGPVLVGLGDPTSPIQTEIDLTDPANDGLLDAIDAGDAYVNVHSPEYPGGEIRGQVTGCVASEFSLCLRNRFEVSVDWIVDVHDFGFGHAVPETDDSGMFWFFNPENLEMLVKVLDGCAINDHFWVFFAATTDVGFTLRVEDTLTGQVQTYENPLGQPADSRNHIEAFPTCDAE